jgi:hypothetical protein
LCLEKAIALKKFDQPNPSGLRDSPIYWLAKS